MLKYARLIFLKRTLDAFLTMIELMVMQTMFHIKQIVLENLIIMNVTLPLIQHILLQIEDLVEWLFGNTDFRMLDTMHL